MRVLTSLCAPWCQYPKNFQRVSFIQTISPRLVSVSFSSLQRFGFSTRLPLATVLQTFNTPLVFSIAFAFRSVAVFLLLDLLSLFRPLIFPEVAVTASCDMSPPTMVRLLV